MSAPYSDDDLARMRRHADTGYVFGPNITGLLSLANAEAIAALRMVPVVAAMSMSIDEKFTTIGSPTEDPHMRGSEPAEWSSDVVRILGGTRAEYAERGRAMIESWRTRGSS